MINLKNKIPFSIKNCIINYLINNESIIDSVIFNRYIFFYTNKRIIIFKDDDLDLNYNKIESYSYNDISAVKYSSHLVNLNKYAVLEISFVNSNKKLILDFPENIIFDICNSIDEFIC